MADLTAVTVEIDTHLFEEAGRLAVDLGESRDWVLRRAIAKYVCEGLELYDSLREADAQIDRGECYTQEEMKAWIASRQPKRAA